MKYLITGGCGFLGSNIAHEILKCGDELVIFDSLYRFGSNKNLEWLQSKGKFDFIHGDIRNLNDIELLIKTHQPDVIYHLAGQVAMTTSINNPRMDFEVNVVGSFNLLNTIRCHSPHSIVIYSSTNKVYGDLEQYTYRELETRYECVEKPNGFNENVKLDFHSPYGVSKGSADQYMLDFARIYDLKTVVFRHSSMFGGRQFSTFDQGWVGWFISKALEIKQNKMTEPFTISGNGKQVRDLLFSDDAVSLYLKSPQYIEKIKGQAFNIGGGIENSCSLLELLQFLEEALSIEMKYNRLSARQSDQRFFVADNTGITSLINWKPRVSKFDGIQQIINSK